ncbi:hypothetical protein WJX81_008535 [Elliptochloris bilobata]|uniref:Uncharacterized protein n=1 Tax=Elliptochloris bilobata TaxID=381761 RepID=A0AAW1S8K4_9CHLO
MAGSAGVLVLSKAEHPIFDHLLLEQLASGLATVADIARALAAGWDPNTPRPESGDTPLHLAARSGSLEVCKALVASGANLLARNNKNRTPSGQRSVGCAEVADFLRAAEAAAAVVQQDRWGQKLQQAQTASACATQTL